MHVICRAEKAVYLPGTTGKNFRAKHMILADQNWKKHPFLWLNLPKLTKVYLISSEPLIWLIVIGPL